MENDVNINDYHKTLMGLNDPWIVSNVELSIEKQSVKIYVEWPVSDKVPCPECDCKCSMKDFSPVREWRHLDTMQFKTTVISRTPRSNCKIHGVKTINIPWGEANSRFTLLFEKFSIDVLSCAKNISKACMLLGISWDQAQLIQKRSVERGLKRRDSESLEYIGIDEKSFKKGHDYISVLSDISSSKVIEVVQGRTIESAETLINTLSEEQKGSVKAIAMDMWEAYISTAQTILPDADIVHDKYHVSKYLNTAVDKARKKEHKNFQKTGESILTKTKYFWLKNPDNWSFEEKELYRIFTKENLKVSRAWSLKETFKDFWNFTYEKCGVNFFKKWFFKATHSRIPSMTKVAYTIKNHIENLLTYYKHRITNAGSEGLNSFIQGIKSNARGFRNFGNYRISILFHLGRLDLLPR